MSTAITIFIIITAAIIAITRVALSVMRDRDEAAGHMVDPSEYKISGLLRLMIKDKKRQAIQKIKK